jgi:hypothetical protein
VQLDKDAALAAEQRREQKTATLKVIESYLLMLHTLLDRHYCVQALSLLLHDTATSAVLCAACIQPRCCRVHSKHTQLCTLSTVEQGDHHRQACCISTVITVTLCVLLAHS